MQQTNWFKTYRRISLLHHGLKNSLDSLRQFFGQGLNTTTQAFEKKFGPIFQKKIDQLFLERPFKSIYKKQAAVN